MLYKRAIKYAPDIPLFSPEPLIHKPSEVSGTAWGKDRVPGKVYRGCEWRDH